MLKTVAMEKSRLKKVKIIVRKHKPLETQRSLIRPNPNTTSFLKKLSSGNIWPNLNSRV